ncbi:MAG: fructosamine kinase family protein [Dinoroseobacter sp.]|nr:fructosamine kinase family protein [Dinoroseobacter sp.]
MHGQGFNGARNGLLSGVEHLLGDKVLSSEPLHGGDLSQVVRLRLASGDTVVAKLGPHPDREARMLRKLADAGARVVAPIASSADVLVLEDLGPSITPNEQSWHVLGENLLGLHAADSDRFGWGEDYAFGKVPIHNRWDETWPEFWIEQRLMADAHALPADIARNLANLRPRLMEILPTHPKPSLLHGDLWSGNVHFTQPQAAYLIDPACYYGHAEVDLAMLTLFGRPPAAFWDAYGPLEEGWELRQHAYQLWPALVHLRLFGDGYRSLVERLAAVFQH